MISNRPPSAAARKTSAGWRQPSAEANRSAAPSGAGLEHGDARSAVGLRARTAGIALVQVWIPCEGVCPLSNSAQTKPAVFVPPARVDWKVRNRGSKSRMPALVLILLRVSAGVVAGLIALRYPWRVPARPRSPIGRKVGESAQAHPRFGGTLERRLDPQSATGLALSIALVLVAVAGVVLGLLAYLVRTNARLASIDNSVAKWGNREASPLSNHVLNARHPARIDLRGGRARDRARRRRAVPDGR